MNRFVVEWEDGEGWHRLTTQHPTEAESRAHAKWVMDGDARRYRIIEITERILANPEGECQLAALDR